MKREERTTAIAGLIIIIAVLIIVISAAIAFLFSQGMLGKMPLPEDAAADYMQSLNFSENGKSPVVMTDGSSISFDCVSENGDAKILSECLSGRWGFVINQTRRERKQASVSVSIVCPGMECLLSETSRLFRENLEMAAAGAGRASEIYDDQLNFRENIIEEAYEKALRQACKNSDAVNVTVNAQLMLRYSQRKWNILNPAQITETLAEKASEIRAETMRQAEYIPLKYHIEENAKAGPNPDQSRFGETTDPNTVMQLLSQPYAKNLIGSENLCWNGTNDFYPGSVIRYYLDESILMLEWQEVEQNMCATFAEIFVADGSQMRRKIAGDRFGDMNFRKTSDFARETNAVLAVGGDFYNHSRNCGIIVYDRQMYRFDPYTCDTCYITSDGDMLFSYRNQWSEENQAREFIQNNDILFSLGFGPVLIDGGRDVTPGEYQWGEINDTYARAALGMLGKNHYLTMNLNCGSGAYYNYATLRQAADAMIQRHCIKAYTLDGGQTATTAVNGMLVNPVQFGWEKEISDIIYFATAVPAA